MAIGGLIVLVLTAALVAPYFVDWTSHRADFEREASRILGRDVTVRGAASARLLPFPSVTFEDVEVAGGTADEPAMTVERFSMDAELAPFLSGEVLIFDMRLVRPRAIIDIGADGTLDWAVRPDTRIGAQQISLEQVTVSDGEVQLRHGPSGRTHVLSDIDASVSARSLAGPWRLDGSMLLDGVATTVNATTGTADPAGSMRLRLRAQPERYGAALDADGTVHVEDGAIRYEGQFRLNAGMAPPQEAGARPPPAAYRLTGDYKLDHSGLSFDAFRLETGPVEDPYTAEGSARFDLGREPSFLVRADGAQLRFEEQAGVAGEGVNLAARLSALADALARLPRPTIPGAVEMRLPAIVAGDTTIRDVQLSAAPSQAGWRIDTLGASLPGRTTLEASGEIALADEVGFEGQLLLAVGQPSGFAAWLARDVDDAIRRLPAAGFSADVSLSREHQSFRDLELILGTARFAGEIERRVAAGTTPSMLLRLEGDRLDVEGMSAFASLFVTDGGANRLADHDLTFDIKAGPVEALGLEAAAIDTAMRLRQGQLEIDRLQVTGLAGANISATGTVRDLLDTPTGNLDATLISADLSQLVENVARLYPANPVAAALDRRVAAYPGLLSDAQIDIVASAAMQDGQGAAGLAISASGTAGDSRFTLSTSAPDIGEGLARSALAVRAEVQSETASSLYALMGLPALPIDFAGPARAELTLDGVPEAGAVSRARIEGEGLEGLFEGTATFASAGPQLTGRLSLASDDLEPWLVTAGVALPGAAFGLPVSLSGDLDYAEGFAVLSGLGGEIAETAIVGDLNIQQTDGRPYLTGSLGLDALDGLLLAEAILGEAAIVREDEGWPRAPFSQSVDLPVGADLELEVGHLSTGLTAPLTDARMQARLSSDGLSVTGFSGSLYGGRASGSLDLRNDAGTGLFSSQFRLSGGALERVLADDALSGELDLAASLTASGKSVEALAAALSGSGSASLRQLAIAGMNPQGFAALLAAADEAGPQIDAAVTGAFAPGIVGDGALSAGDLDLAFTVANGALRAPPFHVETQDASVAGEVRADLVAGTVGADVTLTYAAGQDELVGSEPAIRFLVDGPHDGPSVTVDTEMLAQFLTQRSLEREQARVEAMQAQLLEQQRHRREVRYYAALAEEQRLAALARISAEQEARRLAEMARRSAEEAGERAEAARLAEEERARVEAEAQRIAEEQLRLEAELEALRLAEEEARAAEQDRLREENERLRAEVEALLRERAPPEEEGGEADESGDRQDAGDEDAGSGNDGDPSAILRRPLPPFDMGAPAASPTDWNLPGVDMTPPSGIFQ